MSRPASFRPASAQAAEHAVSPASARRRPPAFTALLLAAVLILVTGAPGDPGKAEAGSLKELRVKSGHSGYLTRLHARGHLRAYMTYNHKKRKSGYRPLAGSYRKAVRRGAGHVARHGDGLTRRSGVRYIGGRVSGRSIDHRPHRARHGLSGHKLRHYRHELRQHPKARRHAARHHRAHDRAWRTLAGERHGTALGVSRSRIVIITINNAGNNAGGERAGTPPAKGEDCAYGTYCTIDLGGPKIITFNDVGDIVGGELVKKGGKAGTDK